LDASIFRRCFRCGPPYFDEIVEKISIRDNEMNFSDVSRYMLVYGLYYQYVVEAQVRLGVEPCRIGGLHAFEDKISLIFAARSFNREGQMRRTARTLR
jgi:hypothetical protein